VSYANGKYAYGLCDFCGQRFPYQELRKNWKGFKVCSRDFEKKAPQLEPLKFRADAEALREPRPDRIEPIEVFVGIPGDSVFSSDGMKPVGVSKDIEAKGAIGNVTVTTT
jgi:hypothetical protein